MAAAVKHRLPTTESYDTNPYIFLFPNDGNLSEWKIAARNSSDCTFCHSTSEDLIDLLHQDMGTKLHYRFCKACYDTIFLLSSEKSSQVISTELDIVTERKVAIETRRKEMKKEKVQLKEEKELLKQKEKELVIARPEAIAREEKLLNNTAAVKYKKTFFEWSFQKADGTLVPSNLYVTPNGTCRNCKKRGIHTVFMFATQARTSLCKTCIDGMFLAIEPTKEELETDLKHLQAKVAMTELRLALKKQ
jgi:hypothetical protein